MPAYNTLSRPPALYAGDSYSVVVPADAIAAGFYSQQVALAKDLVNGEPQSLAVEVLFSANPGNFEVDLLTADTDAAANYVVKAALSAGLNGSYGGRIEVSAMSAKLARIGIPTLQNAVTATIKLTR
jgi:hypothetical protein